MAERSIIDGFGPGVSKWASEETAKAIAKTLGEMHNLSKQQVKDIEKLTKKSASGAGGIDPDVAKELVNSMKDLTNEIEENTEAKERERAATGRQTRALQFAKSATMDFAKFIGGTMLTALGAVTGSIVKQSQMSVELNRQGLNLASLTGNMASGIAVFGNAANEARLSFGELSKLTEEYSATMNRFGIQRFAQMSNQVTRDLRNLGLVADESAELVAEYLKNQRFIAYTESLTEQQRTAAAMKFVRSISEYSKVLGKSRAEIAKSISSSLSQTNVEAFLSSLGEGGDSVREIFSNVAGVFGSDEFAVLRDQLIQSMASMYPQRSELWRELKAVAPEAANALSELSEAAKAGNKDVSNKALIRFLKGVENADVALGQTIDEQNSAALAMVNQVKRFLALDKEFKKRGTVEADPLVQSVANMKNAFREVTNFFDYTASALFNDQAFIDTITSTLSALSTTLDEAAPDLQEAFSNILSGLVPLVQSAVPLLKKFGEWVVEWSADIKDGTEGFSLTNELTKIPLAIGAAIGVAFAGTALVAIIGGALASGISSLLSKVAFGGKGGGGGIFGNLFKGVGKGIGGALEAVAMGLAAFGKAGVAVLKGAAVLAIAIPLIGTGIAGATWIMGAALPKFAEGLRSFEDIDGDNLAKLGDGVMRLGAGLAAMAVGKGLDLFATVGETIFKFFGGETQGPIDVLREFAKASVDLAPGLQNLGNAMSTFAPMLSQFISSMALFETVDVDDVIDGLEELAEIEPVEMQASLPALASSLKAFEGVNGKSLQELGIGVISLAEGLDTLADTESGGWFSSGLSDMFGEGTDESINVLQRFSSIADSVGPGLQSLGNSLKAFVEPLSNFVQSIVQLEDLDDTIDALEDLGDIEPFDNIIALPRIEIGDSNINFDAINARVQEILSEAFPNTVTKSVMLDLNASADTSGISEATDQITQLISEYLNELQRLVSQSPVNFAPLQQDSEEINNARANLSGLVSDYLNEFKQLESISPISVSARVENSPLVADANAQVQQPKTQYQRVNTREPMQIIQPEVNTPQILDDNIAKANDTDRPTVEQRTPEREPEINTLIKEQNKILTGIAIAMETNNKRLKNLVRVNEEKSS